MPEAVLVSAVRTPVGRAPKGALSSCPDHLSARKTVQRAMSHPCSPSG